MASEAAGGNDKRRSPRRSAGWRVLVKTTDGKIHMGRVDDVSSHGFLIDLKVGVKKGDILKLKVEVYYKGKRWELLCGSEVRHVVMRTEGFHLGMQNTNDIDPQHARFLNQYANGVI